jgi:hypothetical protein
MATTGDISSAITNVLTHTYAMKEMEEVYKNKNIFYNLISGNVKSIGGERATSPEGGQDYILLKRYVLSRQAIIGARTEGQDVRLPGTSSRTYGTLYPKQLVGSTGWTREELLYCRNEPQFEDVVRAKWLAYVSQHRQLRDILWQGDGTGRLARVSSYSAISATSGTVTVDNTQANFGWTAGDKLFDGMLVSSYTVADITGSSAWTTKCTECVVSNITRRATSTTSTFVITARTDSAGNAIAGSEIAASPANADIVFIAGAPILDSSNKFSSWGVEAGIHAVVDDGQDAGYEFTESGNLYNHSWLGATIQGVNRSTAANKMYRAMISRGGDRGGTDGTALTTDMNDIDEALDNLFQTNTGPDPDKLIALCNIKTARWWESTSRNELNAFQQVTNGMTVAGYQRLRGYQSASANTVIPVFTLPTMADGTIIFLDTPRLARWDLVPFGPVSYMGKTQFESPGTRNMTFEQWGESFGNLGFERCDTSLRIEDISIA